jgi:hypothetical protein
LVHVGYPYECTFESLDFTLIGGQPVGGKRKICREIDVLVKDTQTFGYATSCEDDLPENVSETISYKYPSYYSDGVTPPLARSEIINCQVQGQWMKDPRIKIVSNSAYPVTILSITPKVEFGT